jgi:hypothetical protein
MEADMAAFCADFRDIPVSARSVDRTARPTDSTASTDSRRGRALKDASSVPTRKTDLYHNCRLEAPDGSVLANLDHDRASWYLRKGLAVVLHQPDCRLAAAPDCARDQQTADAGDGADFDSSPMESASGGEERDGGTGDAGCECTRRVGAIRLLFEPRGRGHAGNEYYTSPKANVCVACGAAARLQRYSVVPPVYRRLMPEALKSRSSFDIVLLCTACHQRADCHAVILREALAGECGAPLREPAAAPRSAAEAAWKEARSLAKALLTAGERIPAERRAYAEETLARYFEVGV